MFVTRKSGRIPSNRIFQPFLNPSQSILLSTIFEVEALHKGFPHRCLELDMAFMQGKSSRQFLGTVERWKWVLWKCKDWSFNWQYVYYTRSTCMTVCPRYHIALVRRLHGYTATVPKSCCCLVSVGYERSGPRCVHGRLYLGVFKDFVF